MVLGSTLKIVVVLALIALVVFPLRGPLYLAIAGTTANSEVLAAVAEIVAGPGLFTLVGTAVVIAVWSWLRDREAFWRLVCAGLGVVGAYLTSEVIKLLVSQPRPCRVLDVTTVLGCPQVGDWSWPSNHSVIAAAFATACIIAAPRLMWFVAPMAVLIAFSRVAAGVHYLHDVASGLALGTALVVVMVVMLRPVVDRLPHTLTTTGTAGDSA
ncbi:phosphatase PAP2 family protein [Kocuria sp. CPCC 205300]|uniref:phosphatase PAP2 family protein n=1 Tax=Kocuria sabuli TaxID=3071448 RepID=UPI0036D9880B